MQYSNVLNEICRATVIQSSGALSKFIATPIVVKMNLININKEDISTFLSNDYKKCIGFYFSITGQIGGDILFIYPERSSMLLYDKTINNENKITKSISKEEIAYLSDTTKVFVNEFMTSISRSLNIERLVANIELTDNDYMSNVIAHAFMQDNQDEEKIAINIMLNIDDNLLGRAIIMLNQEKAQMVVQKFIFDERIY